MELDFIPVVPGRDWKILEVYSFVPFLFVDMWSR